MNKNIDIDPEVLSDIMRKIAVISHQKSPRTKAYFRKIRKIGLAKQKAKKKLSP